MVDHFVPYRTGSIYKEIIIEPVRYGTKWIIAKIDQPYRTGLQIRTVLDKYIFDLNCNTMKFHGILCGNPENSAEFRTIAII